MNKLINKVALITGGNSGIGYATAKKFLDEEARKVILLGRNEAELKKAAESLGNKAAFVVCDSANINQISKLRDSVKSIASSLDVVFLNAGIASRKYYRRAF